MGDRTGYYGNPNAFNQFAEGYGQGQEMGQGIAQQRAGGLISAGDYTGAANALYRAGDLAGGTGLQDHHAAEVADRLKWMAGAAENLAQIPDDGTQSARKQALQQHVLPTLQAMGIDPQTLGALQGADLSDQSLAMFRQKVAHQYQLIQRRDGSVVAVNPNTLQQTQVMAPMPPSMQGGGHAPQGMVIGEDGAYDNAPGYVDALAARARATRAPPRGRSGGGGGRASAAIPPPPSGWSAR